MNEESKPKRNGKFVNIEYAEFTQEQLNQIDNVSNSLKEIFKDREIKIKRLFGQVKIYIELAPIIEGKRTETVFKVRRKGEYSVQVNPFNPNDFTGIIITFNNHIGYSNDPFYSHDYKSKETQLEVWIETPNFRIRPRWHKEYDSWEPQPHFDYAYEIDTLYNETVLPAIEQTVNTFKPAYPELTI